MKRNDKSEYFKDWTTRKLKREARMYYETIYGESACYGKADIQIYDGILNELSMRGIDLNF